MITIEKASGGFVASAMVRDRVTPFAWVERKLFLGYARGEIRPLFVAWLASSGFEIVEEGN